MRVVPESMRLHAKIKNSVDLNNPLLQAFLASLENITVFKTHSSPPLDQYRLREFASFIFVYRDPRDMAVSNAYYLANLDPSLGGWPQLKDMDVKQRIVTYLSEATYDLELLEKWSSFDRKFAIAYEDMYLDIVGTVSNLIRSLGQDVISHKIATAIYECSFEKLSGGRKPGDTDDSSFFRSGVAGDWKKHFDDRLTTAFKTMHRGRWNYALLRLGYESELNWR